jgi:hypothetical protein
VFIVVLASILTVGFNFVDVWLPVTFADDGDKKECKQNDGGNNCNDTKKSASPELECEHEIKDNKDSTIDSECTNNSQILIDSNIQESPSDGGNGGVGNGGGNGNANIELSPTSGHLASSVHIAGTGFIPTHAVTVTFETPQFGKIVVATASTDNNGEFSDDFIVPLSLAGAHTVTASDGSNSASAIFTVTSSPGGNPNILINPTSGPVGTSVNVAGINFGSTSIIIITFDGKTVVATALTDSTGVFSTNFTVPDSTFGEHIVKATDKGGNSDSTGFLVTQSQTATTSTSQQQLSTSESNASPSSTSTATQGMLPF